MVVVKQKEWEYIPSTKSLTKLLGSECLREPPDAKIHYYSKRIVAIRQRAPQDKD